MPGSFISNVNKDDNRDSLDQQFDDALDTQTTSQTDSQEASSTVTSSPNSNTILNAVQDVQVTLRLEPDFFKLGDGVRAGRIRTVTEDQRNLSDRQKVDVAATATTASASGQSSKDITRHRQKNQARCNHLFDDFNGRCIWCNRKKTSQVYDQ